MEYLACRIYQIGSEKQQQTDTADDDIKYSGPHHDPVNMLYIHWWELARWLQTYDWFPPPKAFAQSRDL